MNKVDYMLVVGSTGCGLICLCIVECCESILYLLYFVLGLCNFFVHKSFEREREIIPSKIYICKDDLKATESDYDVLVNNNKLIFPFLHKVSEKDRLESP